MQTLEGIEMTLRQQIQTYVSPELGNFFIQTITGTQAGKSRKLKKHVRRVRNTPTGRETGGVALSSAQSSFGELLFTAQCDGVPSKLNGILLPNWNWFRLKLNIAWHRQTLICPISNKPIAGVLMAVKLDREPLGEEWMERIKQLPQTKAYSANFQNNAN